MGMRGRQIDSFCYTLGDLPRDAICTSAPAESWCSGAFETAIAKAVEMGIGLKDISHFAAEAAIRIANRQLNGSTAEVAKLLKITPRALQMRRQKGVEHV
jgi:hypothetical protein